LLNKCTKLPIHYFYLILATHPCLH